MTQTKQHHSELLQLQTNVEETNLNKQSSPLIEREQIPNTPFWVIGNRDDGYHIILGRYRITNEPLKRKEHAEDWLFDNQWNVVLSIAIIAVTETPNISIKTPNITETN